MRTIQEFDTSETAAHPWREAFSAINPVELWQAFQEAEDQVCLMAAPPAKTGPLRREQHD